MQTITRTTSQNADFKNLILLLDQVLKIADGEEHAYFDQYNQIDSINNVVVCYENGIAIGCGAFKEYEPGIAEIKRMFVHEEHRGKGIASAVLSELELWAKELNYVACILDTNKALTNAVALYKKSGYSITENYGQYIGIECSICMKKVLK